jgi:hypothetical protein
MREGVAGLLREKTRKPGLPPALVDRVVELTLTEPPGEATHWTGRSGANWIAGSIASPGMRPPADPLRVGFAPD